MTKRKNPIPSDQEAIARSTFPSTLSTMRLSRTFTAFTLAPAACAGPLAYGMCQAGCSGIVMACYAAAGFTWGATLGATAPASILLCNSSYGSCQAVCAAIALAPTP
ncbi:hypothetical protein DL546_005261 [Coniochaeta pulveracea]|uniref:Zygote-specific protein n=1 Tax=Coniochaeta pulveracea TaxID=177199 RepID=A0A420YEB9_9PEZI|nr:hypothetical protein DL546_005261 [Coniochaeta pulveracea]